MLLNYKMSTKQYSVTVTPDREGEEFSPSTCTCMKCQQIHMAQAEWDTFIPLTHLQRKMKEVIARIESRQLENKNGLAM
jgi:hypothetical protein